MGGKKSINRTVKDGHRKLGTLGASDDCVVLPVIQGRSIKYALESKGENGPVRIITDRTGEVANLRDPEQNQRSKAAILAKKYQEHNQRLRNIYNAGSKRELTPEEVALVFRIWEGLRNGTGPFEDDEAGTDAGEWISPGLGGGCPSEDNPEPDSSDAQDSLDVPAPEQED